MFVPSEDSSTVKFLYKRVNFWKPMYINGLVLLIGSVFAASTAFTAVIISSDLKASLNTDATVESLVALTNDDRGLFTLAFEYGWEGRVYGSEDAKIEKLELRPIGNSPLIGIVEVSYKTKTNVMAIFREYPHNNNYIELLKGTIELHEHPDLHKFWPILFYYNFQVYHKGPHEVSVTVGGNPLEIVDLQLVREKKSGKKSEFLRSDVNSFYFEFVNKSVGHQWLIALSAAARIWSVTGFSNDDKPYKQKNNALLQNMFAFQSQALSHDVLVLNEKGEFFTPRENEENLELDRINFKAPIILDPLTPRDKKIKLPGNRVITYKDSKMKLTVTSKAFFSRSTTTEFTLPAEGSAVLDVFIINKKRYLILSNTKGVNNYDVALAFQLLLSGANKQIVTEDYATHRSKLK